jgi:geranylgeranyl pyrophosphate synthase
VDHGSVEAAARAAHQYAARAKRFLSTFPPSRPLDALQGLADYVLMRDR